MDKLKIDRDHVNNLISELNFIKRHLRDCRIHVYVSRSMLGYHYVIDRIPDLDYRERTILRFFFLDDPWRIFFDDNRHERGYRYSTDVLFSDHTLILVI